MSMYICTPPGMFKLATVIIGFILVNLGADAVFNSDNYRKYVRSIESRRDGWEKLTPGLAAFGKEKECKTIQEGMKNNKNAIQTALGQEAYDSNHCNKLAPAWVLEELAFVSVAIICIVLSVIALLIPILNEKSRSLTIPDGVLQVVLGVLLIVGSSCLIAAAVEKFNRAKTLGYNDDTKSDLVEKYLDHVDRYQVRFYQKVAAALLGYINAVVYCIFLGCLVIGDQKEMKYQQQKWCVD